MAASAADDAKVTSKPVGVQWLLLGLAVACAAVYLLLQVLFAPHSPPGSDPGDPGDAGGAVAPAGGGAPAPALVPLLTPSAPAVPETLAAPEDTGVPKNAAPKAGHRKAVKAEATNPLPPAPPPPAPEPAPVPRSPPPPAVEAPKDPWQTMNEGLSRCAREDWINRGACEQRLRLQYCPNHWGVVWQCPIGQTDHG